MVHVMWQIQLATQEAIKLQLAKGHVYGWKTFWNTAHVPSLFFFFKSTCAIVMVCFAISVK